VSAALRVERFGEGPPVVLVHGSVGGGASTWSSQRELAERWTLFVVDRPGFGAAPDVERVDFEVDAPLVAEVLGDGAHLVGQSYGGLISLLAAGLRPQAVRSLTVIEPPAFGVARGYSAVEEFVSDATRLWQGGPREPEAFLRRFLELVGSTAQPASPLPRPLERGARTLMVERYPWDAVVPLDELARAPFPKLVVSGAHHAGFDAVCDVLEERLGAERAVIPGAGHGVQRAGAPFNARLERFLRSAESVLAAAAHVRRGSGR
jgi:pimeloyl-ACP methyl ester carboxylesterase